MLPEDVISIPTMEAFNNLLDMLNLTDRQREIFHLKYSRGWTNIEIAQELQVSKDTVMEDLKVIRRKLVVIKKTIDKTN